MKVHVAWEHSSFKNVDLVAIQSSNPQAQIYEDKPRDSKGQDPGILGHCEGQY